jgi:hypothetical protein
MAQTPRRKWAPNNVKAYGDRTFLSVNIARVNGKVQIEPSEQDGTLTVGLVFASTLRYLSLTNMTVEELDAFEALIKTGIELARPICEELDELAQDEYSKGNTRNTRLYRQLPVVTAFPRHLKAHAERLPKRFDLVAYLARVSERFARWPQLGYLGRAGGSDRSLLERAEGRSDAEHDHPEAGDVQGLR